MQFLASLLFAWLVSHCLNLLGLRPFHRLPKDTHWTLRARAIQPARNAVFLNTLTVMFLTLGLVERLFGRADTSSLLPIGVLLGTVLGMEVLSRATYPEYSWWKWFSTTIPQTLLAFVPWVPLVVGFTLMPWYLDSEAWIIIAVTTALLLGYLLGGWLWIQKKIGYFVPANAELSSEVTGVAARMGMPPPAVFTYESPVANALAVVTNHTVLFASRTLEILTPEQVRLVAAHECGHLSESRSVRTARVVFGLWTLVFLFIRPMHIAMGIGWTLFVIVMTWLIQHKAKQTLGAKMETRADQAAIAFSPEEQIAYANALCRMHESSLVPAVMRGKGLPHGHLYDRMLAAGATPDFPRPEPAGRVPVWVSILVIAAWFAFGLLANKGD